MSWRVSEVPALRLETTERSVVLMRLHSSEPFEPTEDSPKRAKLRVGLGLGAAVRMLGELTYSALAHRDGVVLLEVTRGAALPPAVGLCRTWTSWPERPHMDWILKHEQDYTQDGALAAATLFAEQSGEQSLTASRATLHELGVTSADDRPKLSVAPRR